MQTDGLTGGRESSVYRKVFCVCAALAAAGAWAQDVPTLDEVVVTATRVDSTILDSPSSISVISSQQIADSGATDVSQLINGQPGVVVNDYGIQGSTKTVSLRGSTSSQVLVLLDGIRLNSSRDGAVDLSTVPTEIIDHIEIVRGGESALYGTGAIGVVINIITKKAEKPAISLRVTNGSYIPHAASEVPTNASVTPATAVTPVAGNPLDLLDSQNIDLSIIGKVGKAGIIAGGSFNRAANGFTWMDTAGINDWRRMTNEDALSGSGYAGLDAPLFGGELRVKTMVESSSLGAPSSATYVDTSARQGNTAVSGLLSWKTGRFFTDALTLDLKAFYRYDRLSFDDPNPPPPFGVPSSSLHTTHTGSLDLTQKLTFSDSLSAIYGASADFDYVDSTNLSGPRDRLNLAGFLSVPVSLIENLTITPSVRYDYFSDFPGAFSYSLGAVLNLSGESSLRASFASAYRAPTLNELYWVDPYEVGNPNLLPETSYGGEIGWALEKPWISLDLDAFTRLLFDSIAWDPSAASYFAVNIGESLQPGAEIHGRVSLWDHLTLDARYTFIYSLILQYLGQQVPISDNRRVPYVPLHNVTVQARYEDKLFSIGVGGQYVGEKYTDISNTESLELAGYFLANADFRFNAGQNIAFTLVLKNLFNSLYYTQSGFPMPPFSVVTGVAVKL
jgi:vitamin B12 transporter